MPKKDFKTQEESKGKFRKDKRTDRVDDKRPEAFEMPKVGDVSALSAFYSLEHYKLSEKDQSAECYPWAVSHIGIDLDWLVEDYKNQHAAEVENAIKKAAAAYFTTVSPTTLSDMVDEFNNVIKSSLNIFAKIAWLKKCQNRINYIDSRKNALGPMFNNYYEARATISAGYISDYPHTQLGEWSISNSDYAKEILSTLKDIAIAPETADLLYTLFGYNIKLKESDDGTLRFIDFVPYDVIDWINGESDVEVSAFINSVQADQGIIEAAFNKYEFLEPLFSSLGMLYSPKSYDSNGKPVYAHDFTRNLDGNHFDCVLDTDNAIYDIVYSASAAVYDSEMEINDYTGSVCVVSASNFDATYVDSDKIGVIKRITLPVNTVLNAMKGNIKPINTAALVMSHGDTDDQHIYIANPYQVMFHPTTTGITVARAYGIVAQNRITTFLDMPVACTTLWVTGISDDKSASAWKNVTYLGVSDYLISTGDIEAVVSDATYDLIFNGRVDKFNSTYKRIQTLNSNN